jgi:two-component system cell cycle sensor histidine kinase/response regulator CckA
MTSQDGRTVEGGRVEQLEAEVTRLRRVLATVPSNIIHVSISGEILDVNFFSQGFDPAQILGSNVFDFVPAEQHAILRGAIDRAIATREVQTYAVDGATSPTGVRDYLSRAAPIVENGEVTSIVLVATDVTELRRTMRELDESGTRLQLALAASRLGIWTFTPHEAMGSWDEVAREIIGGKNDELPDNETVMGRVHPEDRETVAAALAAAMRSGVYGPIEHRFVSDEGRVRWVEASGLVQTDAQGRPRLVGGVKDITEQRALEARLLEAQKLESIGRLAGGIAHDFNNLLTAVLSNLGAVIEDPSSAASRPLLDEIREATERSAALTSQLLAFARRQVIEPKVVDPNALVGRLEALLRRVLGPRVRLASVLGATGRVRVDPTQLEQVLLNLATNARDAMADGGDLTITTADLVLDGAAGHPSGLAPGRYVNLSVRDTGPGIPADALEHLFEPFFSTREGGIGLGLATCHGIVVQAGATSRWTASSAPAPASRSTSRRSTPSRPWSSRRVRAWARRRARPCWSSRMSRSCVASSSARCRAAATTSPLRRRRPRPSPWSTAG